MEIVFLLQASSTVLMGGAEIQADYIINEVLKHGHDVFYVSDLIQKESGARIKDVTYVFLKSYGRKCSYRNARPLVRILKAIDPDVIYQRWRTPYTGVAAWYARKFGKKLVFQMSSAQDALKNRIPLSRQLLASWISEHLGRYGARRADVIVAQSREQQRALLRHFHRESLLIPNGHPVPCGPFPKPAIPVVIWVANIKRLKQPEIFLNLARALEGVNATFLLVGRPDLGSYQKKIERMAKSLPNVTYAGEQTQEGTNRFIASSSVLVNTSLYEGFPNTFVQAWMRETPVVSLNVDPDNILKEKEIGFCSGAFDRLVEDVRFLIEHEAERVAMGKRAREFAMEHHDIELIGKKYLELFEGLVRPRPEGLLSKQETPE
jgi:glycosyltransferase involved in cell wall biosynthesis